MTTKLWQPSDRSRDEFTISENATQVMTLVRTTPFHRRLMSNSCASKSTSPGDLVGHLSMLLLFDDNLPSNCSSSSVRWVSPRSTQVVRTTGSSSREGGLLSQEGGRILSLRVVGCHVDGGVAPDTVDESGSPRLSARLGRYGATENDAKGREVACGAKAARRWHRDPASNHSPKE